MALTYNHGGLRKGDRRRGVLGLAAWRAKCWSMTLTASSAGIEEQAWPSIRPDLGERPGRSTSSQVGSLAKFRAVEEPA